MIFHHYVRDKDGHIEMEIKRKESGRYTVHYPRYEFSSNCIRPYSCFTEMSLDQLGMIVFAYSQAEYEKLCEYFKKINEEKNHDYYRNETF